MLTLSFALKLLTAAASIYAIIFFVVGLTVLWHELGHWAACKYFGLRTGQMVIGRGPAVVLGRLKIGVLPTAGYVEVPELERVSPIQKFWIAFAGPLASVVLAFLVSPINLPIAKFMFTVAAVNLVPLFNLDGHQMLKAWVAHRKQITPPSPS